MPDTAIGTRIRWDLANYGTEYGQAGTHKDLFVISRTTRRGDPAYRLNTRLPGMEARSAKSGNTGDLKEAAEEWLVEHVTSLGAVFPAAPVAAAKDTSPEDSKQ